MIILLDIPAPPAPANWIALAVAGLAVAFLLFRPRFRKKDPLDSAPFSSLSQQRSVERQMQNLLVELSEMARQITAQLDTRATKLDLLIRQADERITKLQNGNGAAPKDHEAAGMGATPVSPSSLVDAPSTIDPRHAEIYSLADQGQGPREIASRLGQPSGEVELILALRPRV